MRVHRSRPVFNLLTAIMLATASSLCGAAGNTAGTNTPAITHDQADAILEELRAIRQTLERMEKADAAKPGQQARAPRTATLKLEEPRPFLGKPDAPVTVVEFTDYQCPFCRRFNETTFPNLKRDFIDNGKVRWLVYDLPLGFHPNARGAGQAAHCANEQDNFWQMRDMLFRNSAKLDDASMRGYAKALGLDTVAFNACMDAGRHGEAMDRDSASAQQLRITGTPTFIIGTSDDKQVSGRVIVGAQAIAVFRGEIQRVLDQVDTQDTDPARQP